MPVQPAPPATELPEESSSIIIWSKMSVTEVLSHWLFRLGFASIFLVNATYAFINPDDFTKLLAENAIAKHIGHADLLVKCASVNDLLIGILILGGWRKKLTYAWAGAWLLIVASLKLMNLVI